MSSKGILNNKFNAAGGLAKEALIGKKKQKAIDGNKNYI
jgi:hypothetical protein